MSHVHLELSKWPRELTEIQIKVVDHYFGGVNSQVISVVISLQPIAELRRMQLNMVESKAYKAPYALISCVIYSQKLHSKP